MRERRRRGGWESARDRHVILFSSWGGKLHRVDYAVVGWLNG